MQISDHLAVLGKFWKGIVALILLGLMTGATISLVVTPVYTATTALFLTVQSGATAGELQQGSTYAENQVTSYAEVVTKPIVLEPVITQLGLTSTPAELARNVRASAPTGTAIIEIAVVGRDPVATAALANAIGQQVIVTVAELSPAGSGDTDAVKATVVAPAAVPGEWTSPKVMQNLMLGLILGLLVGVGQAVIRDRLDITVIDEADVAEITERSIVGSVAYDADTEEHPLVFTTDPHSSRAEAYRRFRTNLQFLELGPANRSIVVTSSIPGEGKTTSAINLAASLADLGESVLLVDADLRKPSVAEFLKLDSASGLTTVIIGRATLAEAVQPVGSGNLHVLTSGQVPPNPSELLGSTAMQKVLQEAAARYDTVIIDTPPLLPVADAAIVTRWTAGVLVVTGCSSVTRPELSRALASLDAVDANVLGLVLNKVPARTSRYDSYRHRFYPRYEAQQHEPTLHLDESIRRVSQRAAPVSPVDMIRD